MKGLNRHVYFRTQENLLLELLCFMLTLIKNFSLIGFKMTGYKEPIVNVIGSGYENIVAKCLHLFVIV
jgi:hypothetical protein